MKDIVRVTKPGGWIQLVEADGNVSFGVFRCCELMIILFGFPVMSV